MVENKITVTLPKVAIVGRPNVGKSSLFNRITKSRKAIVYMEQGTTRDRIEQAVQYEDKKFILTDTGGFITRDTDIMSKLVKKQIEKAIADADLFLFVCDGQAGIEPQDLEFAELIRKTNKPIFLVLNKADNKNISEQTAEFYRLGFSPMYPVSALHDLGIDDLLSKVTERFTAGEAKNDAPEAIRVAIVGRPNVGKSSFINYLLHEDRVIVDKMPGTTRDTIDIFFTVQDTSYILVDTAGMRHKRKVKEAVDVYSMLRTKEAIKKSEACIVLIDAYDGLVGDDLKILDMVMQEGKALLIGVNKWDLVSGVSADKYTERIHARANFLKKCPVLFTSTRTGYNIYNSFKVIREILNNSRKQIPTPALNKVISAIKSKGPFTSKNNKIRLNYATQTAISPPTFLIFVNKKGLISESHISFIENALRKHFDFLGVSIKLRFRSEEGGIK